MQAAMIIVMCLRVRELGFIFFIPSTFFLYYVGQAAFGCLSNISLL